MSRIEWSICILVVCCLVSPSYAGLDLTPYPHKTAVEGGFSPDTAFGNGRDLITYQAPDGWRISGGGNKATLSPNDSSAAASASIESFPLPPITQFTVDAVKAMKEAFSQTLPVSPKEITWMPDEPSPLLMNGHPTYRITATYMDGTVAKTATVVICNFAAEQIQFRLSASTASFPALYDAFRSSLFTWTGLK